jgi:4-hydroxy-3-methylbut-2-enyl diphosphate reductase
MPESENEIHSNVKKSKPELEVFKNDSSKSGLNLAVSIDAQSGFCFGVVYAIEMAEEILDEEGKLYCLGDIVHNDEEVLRLEKKGLQIIDHKALANLSDVKVLIRAHGEPPETYKMAIENNITLIDASCPVVLKLQNRIRNTFTKDQNVFIYGKHGHAEVLGLLGQTNGKATVFQSIDELDIEKMPRKIALYSQTTKSTESFYAIHKQLTESGIEVDLNDTICRQVSNRDIDLRKFAVQFVYQQDINQQLFLRETTLKNFLKQNQVPENQKEFLKSFLNELFKLIQEIDFTIEKHAKNWKISRISKVDLAILRVAVVELMKRLETDIPVIISEAISIAQEYGSSKSSSFVNGILDSIAKEVRSNSLKE